MKQSNPEPIYLKDYQPPSYEVVQVDLHIELGESETVVRNELCLRSLSDINPEPLILDGEEQELRSVALNGRVLKSSEYSCEKNQLILPSISGENTLEIVSVIYPHKNTALSGLYRSGNLFCTQCEAEGFRRITFYPDRPDVMSIFKTTVVADKDLYPVLLSNGNLVEKGELDHNRHYVVWSDPHRKPSYLFALVAGDLVCVRDCYTTLTEKEVQLEIYVESGAEDKCEHALESLKKAMRWDEQKYGLVYDLDIYMIVAVNDFNMGAMENKGLNIFNAKYVLANQKTATDKDFQAVEAVIGHEYFHNWTGNRVTCRDWFQLSLKEGLTVFREQQFSADCQGASVQRIENVALIRSRQFCEDKGPMAHPVRPESFIEINNFYTMTVYYKGSEVIRMLHTLLGEVGFRKGIDLYFQRHDGQAVTCEDFVQAMSDANRVSLAQFQRWYSQAGTPRVQCRSTYNKQDNTYTLHFQQQTEATADNSPKEPFMMPIRLQLLSKQGGLVPLNCEQLHSTEGSSGVAIFDKAEQSFVFEGVEEEPIPSLFADFSAPVVYEYDYPSEDLILLLQFGQDAFNRWDAASRLHQRWILALMHNQAIDLQPLVQGLQGVLEQAEKDPALVASLLMLPSVQTLGDSLDRIPIEKLIQSRQSHQGQLAEALFDNFESLYRVAEEEDDGSLSAKAGQWRALKNTCLFYLAQTKKESALQLAVAQYQRSQSMTDTMGALTALNDFQHSLRDDCFEDLYSTWKHDLLVVNKWLGLQATRKDISSLDVIQQWMEHEAFELSNPNKVYALIGGFCQSNPGFHQFEGQGYLFLAQQILKLDRFNPQVASRMIEPLTFYQRYAAPHQDLMKQALIKIQQSGSLSSDIYEIVSKSLAQCPN